MLLLVLRKVCIDFRAEGSIQNTQSPPGCREKYSLQDGGVTLQPADQFVHQVRIVPIEQNVVERRPMTGQAGEENSDLIDSRPLMLPQTWIWKMSTPFQIGLGESDVILKHGFQYTKPNPDRLGITEEQVGGMLRVD